MQLNKGISKDVIEAMRYSEIFNISADDLESKGVFNADVDSDSQLQVNRGQAPLMIDY